MDKKFLGNVEIHHSDTSEVLTTVEKHLSTKEKARLFFVNVQGFNIAQHDAEYAEYINNAELLLNDGIGVELGAKLLGFEFKENLNGTDLTPEILAMAAKNDFTVYLLGARPGVAERAAHNFRKQMPGIQIVGCADGYFDSSEQAIADINKVKPDILIVAMGVPMQEKWISKHWQQIDATLMMGVGGFLDFASGEAKRAPKWMLKLRLEWLYRLMREPKRMWRRNLGNFTFFYYIFKALAAGVRKKNTMD